MVGIVIRMTQEVFPDKWDELEKIDPKFNAIEKRLGFPDTKRRLRPLTAPNNLSTIIIETEWPSMAEFEEKFSKAMMDPEHMKLSAELNSIVKSNTIEFLALWPPKF
ncbi:MAG: hypothetical protein ACFFCS_10610 [Candidatus Hodarchaeota archaeon]